MADITLKKLQPLPITDWLKQWAQGSQAAIDAAYHALEPYLLRAAASALRNQPDQNRLTPKMLIQEAWLRLSPEQVRLFKNRQQFFGTIVKAMKFYLIDRYRKLQSDSQGKASRLDKQSQQTLSYDPAVLEDSLDAQSILNAFERQFARQARHLLLVELLGMTLVEVAELTGKPVITIRRDLVFSEAWFERMRAMESALPNKIPLKISAKKPQV